ncbi:MAG TPA: response regulator [Bryobacteraceae bacterium]|jgi:DNA-binding response OmpR family regulator|nr:response regulator [Bryobacteraceae bacterium]
MAVLLVDDDPDQLALREMLFSQAGIAVLKATTVAEALLLARHDHPSCAVVDLCLPNEEDGLTLIRELKKINDSVHILVLTGKRTHGLQNKPEWKSIAAVVTKGSPSAHLLARVKSLHPNF